MRTQWAVCAAIAASLAIGTGGGATQASGTQCAKAGSYYNTQALSGTSDTTFGTEAATTSWSTWHVKSGTFSNEAQWIYNKPNELTESLEGGFYSGHGNGNVNWTPAMLPYYTTSNGSYEYDDSNTFVEAGISTYAWVVSRIGSSDAFVQVGTAPGPYGYAWMDAGYYKVSPPRTNFAQGQVNADGNTMGGGSGETFTESWVDSATNWWPWGGMSVCQDDPYWAYRISGTNDQWRNGGYG